MAVTIPPWLNIDPIAPARIALQANQQRAAAAAADRRAQLEEQRLMAEQEMMQARVAAQERSDARKEEVYRQTHDAALAQQAAVLEYRRQLGGQQNQRQMEALRLREQQVEQQTAAAARKLTGMRNYQEDVKTMSPVEALKRNAADLFSDRPQAFGPAMKAAMLGQPPQAFEAGGFKGVYNPATGTPTFPPAGATALGQESYTARQILDEAGNPIPGMRAIPGVRSARILPGARSALSPEGEVRRLQTLLGLEIKAAELGRTKAEREAARLKVADYKKQLEDFGKPQEKVPGKIDEGTPPGEEDYILPPTDMGPEGDTGGADFGALGTDEQTPDMTDEEAAALDEQNP